MVKSKHILAMLFVTLFISCNRNERLLNDIKTLQSKPIDLCLDSMQYYVYRTKPTSYSDSATFYTGKMALVVYSDSNVCSPCLVKSMHLWLEILDTVKDRYGDELRTYFIFTPRREQLNELKHEIRTSLFEHPVFIDTTNVFYRHNQHIPKDERLHTFLLDKKRNVLLAGSPLMSEPLRKMFYEVVDKEITTYK